MFRILFLGDVVGKIGRRALQSELPKLRAEYQPKLVIVNGENSAGGLGIDQGTAQEIFMAGADVITTGNHVWTKKESAAYIEANSVKLLRPINYAPGAPGKGFTIFDGGAAGPVAIVNAIGRIFMPDLVDCPFQILERVFKEELANCKIRFVDFHAEATSEKLALAYFLDGRATVLVGTHTHVQTADEQILPRGLAYITDAGMCGPYESVIGVDPSNVVQRFTSGRPFRFETAKGPAMVNGVVVDCDETTGKAASIRRVMLRLLKD